jgi:hypothetical protein
MPPSSLQPSLLHPSSLQPSPLHPSLSQAATACCIINRAFRRPRAALFFVPLYGRNRGILKRTARSSAPVHHICKYGSRSSSSPHPRKPHLVPPPQYSIQSHRPITPLGVPPCWLLAGSPAGRACLRAGQKFEQSRAQLTHHLVSARLCCYSYTYYYLLLLHTSFDLDGSGLT